VHPRTGQHMSFEREAPDDFRAMIESLRPTRSWRTRLVTGHFSGRLWLSKEIPAAGIEQEFCLSIRSA